MDEAEAIEIAQSIILCYTDLKTKGHSPSLDLDVDTLTTVNNLLNEIKIDLIIK